jgi:hypothetical protein
MASSRHPEFPMTKLKLFSAAVILAGLALAPGMAQARYRHHQHAFPYWLPYEISFLHNYGPGFAPGTFAYYDGPATVACYQSAAAYLGQDGRRHPCF